ncbi:hypothetical protein SPLC1_S051890 [Arthrospira platensis C1]|nr:hypothetical protein SPLC1_S051890 [Arthrospira platensis C1]
MVAGFREGVEKGLVDRGLIDDVGWFFHGLPIPIYVGW